MSSAEPASQRVAGAVPAQPRATIPFGPIAGELPLRLAAEETGQPILPFLGYVSVAKGFETHSAMAGERR